MNPISPEVKRTTIIRNIIETMLIFLGFILEYKTVNFEDILSHNKKEMDEENRIRPITKNILGFSNAERKTAEPLLVIPNRYKVKKEKIM